jgi:hypothetical protein
VTGRFAGPAYVRTFIHYPAFTLAVRAGTHDRSRGCSYARGPHDESPHVQRNTGALTRHFELERRRKGSDRRRDGSPSPTPPARPRGAVVVGKTVAARHHMARLDGLFEVCPPARHYDGAELPVDLASLARAAVAGCLISSSKTTRSRPSSLLTR